MIIEIAVSLLLESAVATAVSDIEVSVSIPATQISAVGYGMIDSFYTSGSTTTYTRPLIDGKTIKSIQFGNMGLIPSQWSHTGDQIEFTDYPEEAGSYYVVIFYTA